jgi:hypothetical protein
MWNSLQQYNVQQYEIQIFFQIDFLCDGYISWVVCWTFTGTSIMDLFLLS